MSNVVIIYGPIAVGKLTVAELLSKKISYKLTHNHALNDLVSDIFPRTTREYSFVIEKMRFNFLSEIAKAGANFITTHCYSHDFVNETTGLSDPQYMKDLVDILKKVGAQVYVVHLKAEANVLLERVLGESRKNHKKLTNQETMKELVASKDWQTSAPIENQLIIDTTHLSVDETVEKIIGYFKLGNETQN